ADQVKDAKQREEMLRQNFESFKLRLALLQGRLASGNDQQKRQAESIKKVLTELKNLDTEGKFNALIQGLGRKDAPNNLDIIKKATEDSKLLSKDLQVIIDLLTKDDAAGRKKEMDKMQRLLEQLKELIAKQERVRAQTELGRKDNKALE